MSGPPCRPGNTALSIAVAYCSRHTIAPARGPRRVLWVVMVTTSATGTGDGCAPPATSPAMCAASTMSSAPQASAISRNAAKSMMRGYAVAPAMIIFGRCAMATAHFVVVEGLGVAVDAVRHEVVELPAEVHRRPVREVAALVETHPHDLVARLEQREEGRHVRVGTRVRLHVGVLGAEQLAQALPSELFGFVDDEVAAVVALGRIALGVLVREHRALRREHRRRREVLRCDELERGVLTLGLAPDDVGDVGIGCFQRLELHTHDCSLSISVISSTRR